MNQLSQRLTSGYRWVLQPLIVFGILLFGFLGAKGLSSRGDAPPGFAKRVYSPLVSVATTELQETPIRLRATGALQALVRVDLVAQVEGRVVEIHPAFTEGGSFEADAVLIRIEPTDFELAVARARADVSSAETSLEALEAEAQAAREEWRVLHGDKEVPALVAKEPQLLEARARIAAAQASLRGAQLDLERTRIRLPWAGRVVSALVDVGSVVGRNQNLGSVYSQDGFEMSVPLRSDQLRWVHLPGETTQPVEEGPTRITTSVQWPGADASVLEQEIVLPIERALRAVEGLRKLTSQASAGWASVEVETTGEFSPDYMQERVYQALETLGTFPPAPAGDLRVYAGPAPSPAQALVTIAGESVTLPGHAALFEGELDPTSRFAAVVVHLDTSHLPPHQTSRLLPGTFADVVIEGSTVRNVTSLQRSWLRPGGRVWVYEEGRIRFAQVETVYQDDRSVWVRGLEDGTRIVTSDLEVVTDGMQVRIPEEDPTPAAEQASNTPARAEQ